MRRIGLLLVALLAACATGGRPGNVSRPPSSDPRSPAPDPRSQVFTEEGLASWYGKEYHGQPTSSGEIFNMHDLTAAHRTLPFGTKVEVACPSTGKTISVRINDRGPFIPGRIIDLSYKAAVDLGIAGKGVDRVKIRAEGLTYVPVPSRTAEKAPKSLVIQVGAFRDPANAARLRDRLKDFFPVVTLQPYQEFTRVLVGPVQSEEEAARAVEDLQKLDLPTMVRPL